MNQLYFRDHNLKHYCQCRICTTPKFKRWFRKILGLPLAYIYGMPLKRNHCGCLKGKFPSDEYIELARISVLIKLKDPYTLQMVKAHRYQW
jgi:hypothetical protein